MTRLREAAPGAVGVATGRDLWLNRPTVASGEVRLPCRVRLVDGRTFTGNLPARKHRALQLGLLHADSEGLVELTPGTRPPGGKVDIDRRKHDCHYLPGGAGARSDEWLERLLEHAARIVAGEYAYRRFDDRPREEAFVGVAPRTRPQGSKHAVAHSRFLWVDVDKPGELPALWALLADRPCHLLVESGIIRSGCMRGAARLGFGAGDMSPMGRRGLTLRAPGRHTTCTTCTTCRPPVGARVDASVTGRGGRDE